MAKVFHTHDCDACEHIGPYLWKNHKCDLYWCKEHDEYIARWSSEGPDYISCPGKLAFNYPDDHPINVARAIHTE